MNNMLLKNPPRKRYYLPDGTEAPGVTTVLGVLEKPALLKWAWEGGYGCGIEGPETTFPKWLERSKDGSAGVGTITHYLIHSHLNGYEATFDPKYDPAHIAAAKIPFKTFLDYWAANNGASSVILSEYSMVNPRLRYGGTCDLLIKNQKGFHLIDIKTSKAIYEEYYIQLAAYLMLLSQETRFRQMRIKPHIMLVTKEGRLQVDAPSPAKMKKARATWTCLVKMYHKLQEFRRGT